MKATLNKKLHERALAIIEMIEHAEKRIKDQEENLRPYRLNGLLYDRQEQRINKRIATHRAAIERLEKYYIETVNRINKAT